MQRRVASFRTIYALLAFVLATPSAVLAVPVFANGQGVSCEACHTTFPGMTRYGMMVMMSNFQILNRHLQDKALPIAVRMYITSYLANKEHPAQTDVSDLSLLGGGFIGRNVTWYTEQHVIDSGIIGQTEQMWLSWNGLFGGTNSLQLGKFHTPFPFMPAHAWTLSDYLLATQTTGQNDFNPNDARWGLAFDGMSNEFMYNLSYLTGSGPTQGALDYNRTTNPRTLDLNVSYGGMAVPWSMGMVAMRGFMPLHEAGNAFVGSDAFTREGLYYGFQTSLWHFQTMYYHGFDAQPGLTESDVSLNGFMFEVERDIGWRNHVLLRYDVASSDTLNRQYVLDLAHNVLPNLALIGELATGPGSRPRIGLQIAFAGPYQLGKRYLLNPTGGVEVVPVSNSFMASEPGAGTSGIQPSQANLGAQLVAQNGCTGCHGANFEGGVGPQLFGIEHHLAPSQISGFIKNPRAPMPNFGFSDVQIDSIVAYLSSLDGGSGGTGTTITLDPANPTDSATILVRFSGNPPAAATASAIMHMGQSTHRDTIDLHPTSDPHVWSGVLHFSMAGPWTIEVRYGQTTIDRPIMIGGM